MSHVFVRPSSYYSPRVGVVDFPIGQVIARGEDGWVSPCGRKSIHDDAVVALFLATDALTELPAAARAEIAAQTAEPAPEAEPEAEPEAAPESEPEPEPEAGETAETTAATDTDDKAAAPRKPDRKAPGKQRRV